MPDPDLMQADVSVNAEVRHIERLFDRNKGLTIQKSLMMSGSATLLRSWADISVSAKWVRLAPTLSHVFN
jgi:hypothetical protein